VVTLARIAQQSPGALPASPAPAAGDVQPNVTRWLHEALEARNAKLDVTVTRSSASVPQVVSFRTPQGWISMPMPDLPRREGALFVIISWVTLIALGAIAIAVFITRRMIQPLALLERTIESVGHDALLPELPVQGPAEVRVAARALNSLSSRLKAAMESRMRLVAAAGHDMRTPITRMRLRAEFVSDPEDRAMWLKDIDELEHIADSAILLVRQEAGNAPVETLELAPLVQDAVRELSELGYVVELRDTVTGKISANPLSLSRALRNLIINAATHGKSARVSMAASPTHLRVVIEDDGPGIPAELMGQVFEPFFRADPARRQDIPGAGLGLTIAREIVRRIGGDIHITNRESSGLRQVMEFPKLGA
jgi:signal transduction histidine kinase